MRNSRNARMRSLLFAAMGLCLALLAGCASDKKAKVELGEGYTALESRQYDEAIGRANAFLQHTPAGPGSAEALYLKGRALEQKTAANQTDARANLQAARIAYIEALSRSPSPKLEAYIHTSLANVAYFQDDYATAINEWSSAYDKLDDENAKAWALYRVGVSKQRLGQFADADTVFAAVQQRYPNSVPAQRAREHQGVRGFSVQLATFSTSAAADAAIGTLRREGVLPTKQADSKGRYIVLAGPMPSYQQAQSLKARYALRFSDAIIVP